MKAHIIIEPDVEVGTKTLAACGKEHKVKVLWPDVPADATICRACVDYLLRAVNDANDQGDAMARVAAKVYTDAAVLFDLSGRESTMTRLIEDAEEYAEERKEKATRKAAKKAEKNARDAEPGAHEYPPTKKCSCLWTRDNERILQLDCPVHDTSGSDSEQGGDEG